MGLFPLKTYSSIIRVGTDAETTEEHCSLADSQAHIQLLFLKNTSQDDLAKGGIAHNGQGPPTSTINQEN